MHTKLGYFTPILGLAVAALAIAAAPLASAAPPPTQPGPVATQSCTALGSAQTDCQSPGNAQIFVAPPQIDHLPYDGGAV